MVRLLYLLYPRWNEIAKDRRASGIFTALSFFLLVTFVGIQIERGHLFRVSSEALFAGVYSPAPWMPELLAENRLNVANLRLLLGLVSSLLLLAMLQMYRQRPRGAMALLSVAVLFFLYLYGMNTLEFEVFYHVFFLFALVFVFFPDRGEAIRLTLCVVYWLAGILKLNPSWLSGRVFLSVPGGELPFLPDAAWAVVSACWLLVAVELFFPFLFLAKNIRLRRVAWWVFFWFHVYSYFLIGYKFPLLMLSVLLPLYPRAHDPALKIDAQKIPLLVFLGSLLIVSQAHLLIPGAKLVTQEGKTAGLFMYDANHVCRVELELRKGAESIQVRMTQGYRKGVRLAATGQELPSPYELKVTEPGSGKNVEPDENGSFRWNGVPVFHPSLVCSTTKRVCCDPYVFHSFLRRLKEKNAFDQVGLTLSIDLNGHGRWFKVVDEENFDPAKNNYSFFHHNPWIRVPEGDFPAEYLWP